MKTFKSIPLVFLVFLACQREESLLPPAPEPQLVEHTLYASTPGEDAPQTRTIISPYNDEKILWSAQERISILSGGGNYPFQGNNDIIESSASFTGMGPANLGNYIALYPYDASASYDGTYVSTTLPAVQTGRVNTFANGYLVTADDATGNSISFNHLCSGIRFEVNTDNIKAVSIRGNNGEKIGGDFRVRFASKDTPVAEAGTEGDVTLKAPDGSFEKLAYYYIVILPTTFTKGFTLIADNGTQIGEFRIDSEVTFSPGVFKRVTGLLDNRITTWKGAMAYYGPENSFCLRPGGSVSFDVTPRLIEDSWQRGPVPAVADVPDGTQVLWGDSTASLSADKKEVDISEMIGGKTGFTYEAGYYLAYWTEINGLNLIVVTGHAGDEMDDPLHVVDAEETMERLHGWRRKTFFTANEVLHTITVNHAFKKQEMLYIEAPQDLTLDIPEEWKVTVTCNLPDEVKASYEEKEITGSLIVKSDDHVLFTKNYTVTVPREKNFFARQWLRIKSWFSKDD